jgi:hypothetical protein
MCTVLMWTREKLPLKENLLFQKQQIKCCSFTTPLQRPKLPGMESAELGLAGASVPMW